MRGIKMNDTRGIFRANMPLKDYLDAVKEHYSHDAQIERINRAVVQITDLCCYNSQLGNKAMTVDGVDQFLDIKPEYVQIFRKELERITTAPGVPWGFPIIPQHNAIGDDGNTHDIVFWFIP